MHGITFALFYSSVVLLVSDLAPEGLASTLQGIFTSIILLGRGVAVVIGAFVINKCGYPFLFLVTSVAVSIAMFLILIEIIFNHCRTVSTRNLNIQDKEEDIPISSN